MKVNKLLLFLIGAGIWAIFLQNFGLISTTQNVYVKGGYVSAEVEGRIEVEYTIDVNLESINGHRDAFYNHSSEHPDDYYRIPIYTGQ